MIDPLIIWRLRTLAFAALAFAVFGAIECPPVFLTVPPRSVNHVIKNKPSYTGSHLCTIKLILTGASLEVVSAGRDHQNSAEFNLQLRFRAQYLAVEVRLMACGLMFSSRPRRFQALSLSMF